MNPGDLKQKFYELYGNESQECKIFFAPGRVNLIGEHTDYNGGYVFPCALQYGTYLLVRTNDSGMLNFNSTNVPESVSIQAESYTKPEARWVSYPLGVIDQLVKRGFEITGMDMLFSGDVPSGAGLSSSASIEMVTGVAVNALLKLDLDMIDLIKIGQKAENEYVGVNCGIMDQYASGMGKTDHAVLLDCASLEYEQVPLVLGDYSILISNTNRRRGLADSKYNERRSQCESAVEAISGTHQISLLGELNYDQFIELKNQIPDATVRKRAKHVVSENQRCLDAVKALKASDLNLLGELMNLSHDSLREDFIKQVGSAYHAKTGLKPEFYIGEVGDGAVELV